MKFVSEDIINGVIQGMGDSHFDYAEAVLALQKEQPVLLGYLFSENFKLIADKEQEFTLYLLIVIWLSCKEVNGTLPRVEVKAFEDMEELNWIAITAEKEHSFRKRLDVFFDGTEQEDILAFIEDALLDDGDETGVAPEAREPIFIYLKSIVDCFHELVEDVNETV